MAVKPDPYPAPDERRRFTITITPTTENELQLIIDDLRKRFGRKPLIHVIGNQPSDSQIPNVETTDASDGLIPIRLRPEILDVTLITLREAWESQGNELDLNQELIKRAYEDLRTYDPDWQAIVNSNSNEAAP